MSKAKLAGLRGATARAAGMTVGEARIHCRTDAAPVHLFDSGSPGFGSHASRRELGQASQAGPG